MLLDQRDNVQGCIALLLLVLLLLVLLLMSALALDCKRRHFTVVCFAHCLRRRGQMDNYEIPFDLRCSRLKALSPLRSDCLCCLATSKNVPEEIDKYIFNQHFNLSLSLSCSLSADLSPQLFTRNSLVHLQIQV